VFDTDTGQIMSALLRQWRVWLSESDDHR